MTPLEIYEEYKLMPNLQLHQLRVTAVAKQLCDNFSLPIDSHTVVLACLFHDMGNILKFDLTFFPEFLEPQGLAYWEGVKEEYKRKYGDNQHEATLMIGRELQLSEPVLKCMDAVAFSKAPETFRTGSWEEKVCEYADSRVGPKSVMSLDERLREARKRYEARRNDQDISIASPEEFEAIVRIEHEMEKQLFAQAKIAPEDITDESIAPIIEELKKYPVS